MSFVSVAYSTGGRPPASARGAAEGAAGASEVALALAPLLVTTPALATATGLPDADAAALGVGAGAGGESQPIVAIAMPQVTPTHDARHPRLTA